MEWGDFLNFVQEMTKLAKSLGDQGSDENLKSVRGAVKGPGRLLAAFLALMSTSSGHGTTGNGRDITQHTDIIRNSDRQNDPLG